MGRANRGFSMVELLVATAIIGVLTALLLPAVQKVRETARKTQCRNHLRQISLALHSYHEALRSFPPGGVSSRKPQEVAICADSAAFGAIDMWAEAQDGSGSHGTSWMVLALPYVDQGPRYAQWNFDDSVAGNRRLAEANIPLFYCPSRRSGVRPEDLPIMFGGWTAGGNDYGGCIGACNGWHDCGAHESWVVGTDRRPEGSCKGAFRINSRTRIHDVTDGTTNTLLLGELQRLNGGTDITTSRDGWAVGGVSTMFSSCSNACDGPNSPHFEELGSAHPGGTHVALVDGSVRYLANEINLSILSALGTMAGDGPSEF